MTSSEKISEILRLIGVAERDIDSARLNFERLDSAEIDRKLEVLRAGSAKIDQWRALRGSPVPVETPKPTISETESNIQTAGAVGRLYASIVAARDKDPTVSRTAKLFRDGVQKMAKKLVEESIEVGLDAVQMNREAVILESADMLYHLSVIWAELGVAPHDVFKELDRREHIYGIAEKLPKAAGTAHARRAASVATRRKEAS